MTPATARSPDCGSATAAPDPRPTSTDLPVALAVCALLGLVVLVVLLRVGA